MTANRSITLTDREVQVEAEFNALLDEGASVTQAGFTVRAKYRRECRATFYRWLMFGRAT